MADLAQAAYINFDPVPPDGSSGDALKEQLAKDDINWPQARREEFISHWRVIAHQSNTSSGFSATLFERIDPESGEPRYVVAMRGTEANIASQLYADLAAADLADLVANGLAWEQILDMYNWWQEVSTPTTSTYTVASTIPINDLEAQSRIAAGYNDVIIEFGQARQIVLTQSTQMGQGFIGANEQVDVTGHSLGGHLATAFSRLFTADTANVVTVNGAGYSILGEATGNTDRVFAKLGGASSFPAEHIVNLYGDRGVNIVTQNSQLGLYQPGSHVPVFIENTSLSNTVGHGAGQMAQSLAIYDMLLRLEGEDSISSPAEMLNRYRSVLETATNQSDESLERVLGVVYGMLLTGGTYTATATGDLSAFFSRLYELLESITFQDLMGKVRVHSMSTATGSNARLDFGAFLALYTISPIVLEGKDPAAHAALTATWQQVHGDLYMNWASDKNAHLDGDTEHIYTFTEQWLSDRATLLEAIVSRNIKNGSELAYSDKLPVDRAYELRWIDAAGTEQILFAEHTARPGGVLRPVPTQRIAFGGAGADTLNGTDNARFGDHLYGGSGDDTLNGQGGNDYLEGGQGNDTYQFAGNWGKDTVFDVDGLGQTRIDGQAIGTAFATGKANQWAFDLGGVTVNLAVRDDPRSSTGQRLVITKGTDSVNTITIDHFDLEQALGSNGYLGIKLDPTRKFALKESTGSNVWSDPGFSLGSLAGQASTLVEGTARTFTFYLNQATQAGDTITLALSGLLDKFKAILGDAVVDAHGAVITLAQG